MKTTIKSSAFIITLAGLAGCAGAPEPFAFATSYATFEALEMEFAAQTVALVDEDGDLTDPEDISTVADFDAAPSGTVTYNGAILASEEDLGGTMIGQLQLDVAFDTNSLTGTAGNFIHDEDGVYVGLLTGNSTFTDSVVVDNNFTMTLSGALSNGGSAYDTDLALQGNFLNDGGPLDTIAGDADLNLGEGAPVYEEGAFAVVD